MEDCHYYLRSLCAKGSLCRFRHSEVAKKSNVLCPKWQAPTGCPEVDCPLIHSASLPESPENIECVFEKKGGCKKPGCPFKHTKTDSGTSSPVASVPLTEVSDLVAPTPASTIRKPIPQELESLRKVHVPLSPVDGQRTVRVVAKRPLLEDTQQMDVPRKFHKAQVMPNVVAPPTTTKEDKARLAQEEADLYLSTTIDYTPAKSIPPVKSKTASLTTTTIKPVMDADTDDDLEDLLRQQPPSDMIEDSNVDIDELLNTIG